MTALSRSPARIQTLAQEVFEQTLRFQSVLRLAADAQTFRDRLVD
jgi:hypothetical protein